MIIPAIRIAHQARTKESPRDRTRARWEEWEWMSTRRIRRGGGSVARATFRK
jgi:hypothetical protein